MINKVEQKAEANNEEKEYIKLQKQTGNSMPDDGTGNNHNSVH